LDWWASAGLRVAGGKPGQTKCFAVFLRDYLRGIWHRTAGLSTFSKSWKTGWIPIHGFILASVGFSIDP
jgi:hypothetical protein